MQIKKQLRELYKDKRRRISYKDNKDIGIYTNFINSAEYMNAKAVLIYVSLEDEIKTDEIIDTALRDKKTVAVPFCKDSFGNMDFYVIKSLDDLKKGSFGVREPITAKCEKLLDFSDSIIVVPGLAFDRNGYRLGYGKGFYDRFLCRYKQKSFGLCYDEMIVSEIPRDKYDKSVDAVITQSKIIICNSGGENG